MRRLASTKPKTSNNDPVGHPSPREAVSIFGNDSAPAPGPNEGSWASAVTQRGGSASVVAIVFAGPASVPAIPNGHTLSRSSNPDSQRGGSECSGP